MFEEAEQYAHKVNKSRSQLYVEAIKEYLARHGSDNITAAMNDVCNIVGEQDTAFATRAAQQILNRESW